MLRILALLATITLFFVFMVPVNAQKSAVLGIDLGAAFFKIAVVKTGGFDIVLDEASKRKMPPAMSLVKGERLFGHGAYSMKTRYPKSVILGATGLIGKTFDSKTHEQNEFGSYHMPFSFKKDETRGTVIYDTDGSTWSPDEVMGMIFHYIKDTSQKHIEGTVSECVVTVPPYLTEHERRLIVDAAAMVELSVLMLINDNTAVALRYGIESPKAANKKNNVLFLDMGSHHTTATVATYETRNITSYKQVPSLQIMAAKWAHVGGKTLTSKLTAHFAADFDEKHKKKIHDNIKAITKLRQSTDKIKEVLSANKDTMLMVESLMDDIDFKSKITRSQFEELNAETFKSIETTIKDAIAASGLKVDEIHEVIPFGGGTRSPKIKELVLKATEREAWQPAINTDEAAALGAAFVAANFSKSFRLREYHVYDMFPYSIGINVNGKSATLFKPNSVMEAKKTISQPLSNETLEKDFLTVTLRYDDDSVLPAGTPTGLATFNISGMKKAIKKFNVTGTPKVSIAVGLARDAICDVLHAELKVHSMDWVKKQRFIKKNVTEEVPDVPEKKKTNKTKGNSSNSSNTSNTTSDDKAEEDEKPPAANASNTSASNVSNATVPMKNVTRLKTVEVWEENLEKKLHIVTLKLDRKHDGVAPLSDKEFKAAQARHEKFFEEEKERTARADAKNGLEAWIFSSRDKLSAEGMEEVSTEEERTAASDGLQKGEDWLWEDGDNVEPKVYAAKQDELAKLVKGMFYRLEQKSERGAAIEHFTNTVKDAKKRAGDWAAREVKRIAKNESTWIHVNDTNRLLKMCNESEVWLKDTMAEIEKAGLLVKPPVSANEIKQHVRPIENEVGYLRSKPKPKSKHKPKKKVKTNGTNSTGNATNGTGNATAKESATNSSRTDSGDGVGHEEL